MEMRAYLEGIWRRWWLVVLTIILSLWIGQLIGVNQTPEYTASTTILLNDRLLQNTAFPSNSVQLNIPTTYQGRIDSPDILSGIIKTYPRLSITQLQKAIVATTDLTSQVLLINVNDISPGAAQDIANFLARRFVSTQKASLRGQMEYYRQWLQDQITQLNDKTNTVNVQIDRLVPQRDVHAAPPVLTPQQQEALHQYQSQVNLYKRTLYDYQQALTEVQNALPLVAEAYVIIKPASKPITPTVAPLPVFVIQLIAVGAGLFLVICIIIGMDFFTSTVRHRRELLRIVGISTLAELPQPSRSEQQRLLQSHPTPFTWRIKPLRLLCASVSAMAAKGKGHTILLTSPHKKQLFAAVMASCLARKGQQVLLIDADFDQPSLHQQIKPAGPSLIKTSRGEMLPFVSKTTQANLFILPATATIAQNRRITSATLLELLPELQNMFDIIIVDAPPVDNAATHLLATKVAQILMLIKKRRDRLKTLRETLTTCERLKLNTHYVFLT